MRKCWSPAFSPFLTMFSIAFFLSVVIEVGIVWERAKRSNISIWLLLSDTTLGELVTEILAKSSSEQSSNWKFRDEAQRSLGDNLDLKNDLDDVINLELAESEFVGDCKGGKCHYCAKLLKHDGKTMISYL